MDQSTDLDRPVPSLGWHKIKNQDPENTQTLPWENSNRQKNTKKMFDLLLSSVLNSCEQKNIFFFKTQNHVKPLKKCCNLVFGGFCEKFLWDRVDQGRGLSKKNFFCEKSAKTSLEPLQSCLFWNYFFWFLDAKLKLDWTLTP